MQLTLEIRSYEKKVYTVYRTTNLLNGKFYVGYHATLNLDDDYLGSGSYLWRSILKYGWKNFKKEVLFVFDSMAEAISKEKDLIALYKLDPDCMNLHPGGSSGFLLKHSDEVKEYLRKINLGKTISIEHRAAISQANKGKPKTLLTRQKLSLANTGKPGRTGYQTPLETKKRISTTLLGHVVSEETRLKLSVANTGKVHSEETKAKIGDSQRGKILSEETKAKMSLAKKGIPKTEEHKAKLRAYRATEETKALISKNRSGKGCNRICSEETREKLRQANTGYKHSEEAKAKMSASLKGKTHSEETKAKMSASQKGKTRSPETRARMALAQQRAAQQRKEAKLSQELPESEV